eukprot:jgi/Ulvmu1/5553/UM023_0089.1
MVLAVRTIVALVGCSCVFISVTCYFIYAYRVRRAATLRSQRAEEAAARFYAELLARNERDRAARANGVGADDEAEDDPIDLDERIPFLVMLPDKSLNVALLDEELSFRAPGAVRTTSHASGRASTASAASAGDANASDDEATLPPVELPTAFIAPPCVSDALSIPAIVVDAATSDTNATSTPIPATEAIRESPAPPAVTATPTPPPRPSTPPAERENMSQRLWRIGSAVFGAGDGPSSDIPPRIIWTIVTVDPAVLPAAFLPTRDRSTTLRGSLWRPQRSFHHLSGALGLHRAESGGSSRSMFQSNTQAIDAAAADSAIYMPIHPEEEHSGGFEGSEDEESAGIAADYPKGTWPESMSPRLRGISGRFRRADSNRSMSRRGSASGRLGSLSKSLSQVLALSTAERRERDGGRPTPEAAAVAPLSAVVAAAAAAVSAGTAADASAAAAADSAGLPPHSVAVALPVM